MAGEQMFPVIPENLLLTGHRWTITPEKTAFKCHVLFFFFSFVPSEKQGRDTGHDVLHGV